MNLTALDLLVFLAFLAVVIAVSLWAGRRERNAEDYFLAGRSLPWWLIGFSLIASNISTEHFVGMAGAAYGRVGLAIASYEWMAAVTLVIVALWLLPHFLRAGIYTMPEFLEYRYDVATRTILAVYLLVAYVVVFLATVLYSGAVALNTIFDVPALLARELGLSPEDANQRAQLLAIWSIGILAGAYTVYGGLKAVVWSDLLQGAALLGGGALVAVLALQALGNGALAAGWSSFTETSADKLHTVLPWNDPDVPWVAVFVGGLWIPNLFYWGLNQFITQRTLAARNLAQGQRGIFLAAVIKILIPFLIVLPGIAAYRLYGDQIAHPDQAYPFLITRLLPPELRGVMLAALAGAVMSSFNSGLNSASTILTVDLYGAWRGKGITAGEQVSAGRISTAVLVVIACWWAPTVARFEGVFRYIQEVWGFITPATVAVFIVGLLHPRTPPRAARVALLLGVPLYAFCRFGAYVIPLEAVRRFNEVAFLHHMMLVFALLVAVMLVITWKTPLTTPVNLPVSRLDLTPAPERHLAAAAIVLAVGALYVVFR